jgi:acyl-CoA synthetase (AMP-forming)/AMP-acid ligase II
LRLDLMLVPPSRLGAITEIESGLHWDAATLAREVSRRVGVLSQYNVGPGTRVAIAHAGTAQFFADLLATWRIGAMAACLNPALTASELANVIAFTKPAVILTAGKPIETGAPILDLASATASSDLVQAVRAHEPSDAALVLFTSGTTGTPKGVVLSFGALEARIAANIAAIGGGTLQRTLVTLPTHFGHGLIGNALTPLFAGGTILLPPASMALAANLGSLVDLYRIGFMTSVPALWRIALKLSAPPKSDSLQRVHIGSAPLSATLWSDVAAWTRCETVNCYGMTETANWFAGASSRIGVADGLVGTPWEGVGAVRDANGPIMANGEGEIVAQSCALMAGYLDRPDLTAEVIKGGWYHTGDWGRIDEYGRIWLVGRIKDEINRAGVKVQPAEVDRLLETHPAVAEACAFGVPDSVGGESVAVAVKLNRGIDSNVESLRAWCRERLHHEAVPEQWFIIDEIPRTARGKVSRDAVRRILMRDKP